jgi:hypothetical protein
MDTIISTATNTSMATNTATSMATNTSESNLLLVDFLNLMFYLLIDLAIALDYHNWKAHRFRMRSDVFAFSTSLCFNFYS